jgi:2-aminoethylphosphonate transport system permease protein
MPQPVPLAHRVATRYGRTAWTAPPLIVLGGIFFFPMFEMVRESLEGGGGMFYMKVLQTPIFLSSLSHTLQIGIFSTLGCLALGSVLAVLLAFAPFPGAEAISRFIDVFLAYPSFLVALSLTFIYGAAGLVNGTLMELFQTQQPPLNFLYTTTGVILAETTFYTPFVMRPLLAAFSMIERSQIEVALCLGASPRQVLREIIIPAALPALLAGSSLCLMLTLNEFGIIFYLGAKGVITLPMLIYGKAIQEFDYAQACVIAVVSITLSLSLYGIYLASSRRLSRNHDILL